MNVDVVFLFFFYFFRLFYGAPFQIGKIKTILKSLIQREVVLDLGHMYSCEQDF